MLIDQVLVGMTCGEVARRMGAGEALERLQAVIKSVAPELLLVAPVVSPGPV